MKNCNGIFKIPMQFFILLTGILVFLFYQFNQPPVFFNEAARQRVVQSENAPQLSELEGQYETLFAENREQMGLLMGGIESGDESGALAAKTIILSNQKAQNKIRDSVKALVVAANPRAETKDTDYVFVTFIMNHLPVGLVGLLFAVIFCAAMSSTSSELNALASTTCVDIYKRSFNPDASDAHYVKASKWLTFIWGIIAIIFATLAPLAENLIQLVNILGSIFYGTILGIFLVAFLMKWIQSNAVFIAAVIAELLVLYFHFFHEKLTGQSISFLWYNVIGCVAVMVIAAILQPLLPAKTKA